MNKNTIKKLIGTICMVFFMAVCVVPSMKTEAAANAKLKVRKNITVYADFSNGVSTYYLPIENHDYDAKLTKVKSSKTSVASVYGRRVGKDLDEVRLILRKPGKTKVTFTVKQEGRAAYKLSTVLTVKKTPNPFKTFKAAGKNIKPVFDIYSSYNLKVGKKATKISVSMKKGYKILGIRVYNYNTTKKAYVMKDIIAQPSTKDEDGDKSYSYSDKVLKSRKKTKKSFSVKVNGDYATAYVYYTYKLNGEWRYGSRQVYLYR